MLPTGGDSGTMREYSQDSIKSEFVSWPVRTHASGHGIDEGTLSVLIILPAANTSHRH
jgi:hypothetical protein